jgi:hypothetical protein
MAIRKKGDERGKLERVEKMAETYKC